MTKAGTPSQGKLGQAFSFGAASGALLTSSVNTYGFGSGDFTVSFWMKSTTATCNIMALTGASTAGYFALILSGSQLYWQSAYAATNGVNNSAAAILDGKWHLVTVRRSGTTETMLFDGVQQASTFTDSTNYNQTSVLRIGNGAYGQLIGSLDDIRIYNRALSTAEITQLYNTGK